MTISDLELLDETVVRCKYERGDFYKSSDLSLVKRWLSDKDKERKLSDACDRASKSADLDASRQRKLNNLIAIATLILSATIGLKEEIFSTIDFLLKFIKP